MPKNRTPYYESDNPTVAAVGVTWRAMIWIICIVLFAGAVSAGIWYFNVATSDVKGKGDAVRTVNAGVNQLAQQAYFQQTYADIQAADRKLDQLAADKAAKVEGADIRYSGAVSYCQGLIGDYNAAARKEIASKFRDIDLPDQIAATDPKTDCKETVK